MNELEFYQRAATDAAFRRAKLDDLRYLKQVGAGLTWFCGTVGAAFWLYSGLNRGEWDHGLGLFVIAGFCVCQNATYASRLAALQSLEVSKP